jgi:hypothetical protein
MHAYFGKRRDQIKSALDALRDRGGDDCMITFTLRHDFGCDLVEMRQVLSLALKHITSSKWWRTITSGIGYVGYVWVVESTHGPHGWHPHLHLLMFSRSKMDRDTVAGLETALRMRWIQAVEKVTYTWSWLKEMTPDFEHGVSIVKKNNAEEYLSKMGLAAELSASPSKEGRDPSHRALPQIVADYCQGIIATRSGRIHGNVMRDFGLLTDYLAAMKGFKICFTTPGLAKRIDAIPLIVPEELAHNAVDGYDRPDESVLVHKFDPDDWNLLRRMGPMAIARVESIAEQGLGSDSVVELLAVIRAWIWRPPDGDVAYGPDARWEDIRADDNKGWSPLLRCDVPRRMWDAPNEPREMPELFADCNAS